MPDFSFDSRLEADSQPVLDLPLCALRLMGDANYPWLVLIPRRAGLVEIVDLAPSEQLVLMGEIRVAAEALRASVPTDKLNIAALGNMVRQLHIHVVARREGDPAWPRPIWGAGPLRPYPPGEAEALASRIAARLSATGP